MRIAVDAACWANGRGYGRYARELVAAMIRLGPSDQFVCFVADQDAAAFDLEASNLELVRVPQSTSPTEAAAASGNRSPADLMRFSRAVRAARFDVFFFPSVYTYFPLPLGRPGAVAVHDAIAERFPALTLPSIRARLFWWAKVRLALWQCRTVITVSDFAAQEIERELGVSRARIRVTNEAPAPAYRPSESPADVEAAASRIGLPPGARWFVYVGGFNPHKRLDVIIDAHAAVVREQGASAPYLLMVGSVTDDVFHRDLRDIHRRIAEAGTEAYVRWTGFVPDDELRHLHSGAVALLLVSECEGFGLPAVEAAACGTPVVATLASPLPVLLEGGGMFVPPGDCDALVGAMRALLKDEPARRVMGRRARERAGMLSWEASADVALAALREAVP